MTILFCVGLQSCLQKRTACLSIYVAYGWTDSHVQEMLRGLFPVFDEDSYPVGAYLGAMLSEGGWRGGGGQVPAVIITRFMISPRSARFITGGRTSVYGRQRPHCLIHSQVGIRLKWVWDKKEINEVSFPSTFCCLRSSPLSTHTHGSRKAASCRNLATLFINLISFDAKAIFNSLCVTSGSVVLGGNYCNTTCSCSEMQNKPNWFFCVVTVWSVIKNRLRCLTE